MEGITEEQQLDIVRKRTELATISTRAAAIVATIYLGLAFFEPAEAGAVAIFGVAAIALALTALIFAMVRRNVIGVAFMAIVLTADTLAFFAWLLPLLPRG